MEHGLYSGVAAMRANERRMESITANLANAESVGYKRRATSVRSFQVGSGDRQREEIVTAEVTDFSQGLLERTRRSLDFGLMGDGFFVVDSHAGETYTRNGAFHVNAEGVLLTREGHPVAWDGGRGHVNPVGKEILVDGSGQVLQGTRAVGRLRIVDFEDKQSLTLTREGYYRAPENAQEISAEAEVHQGALEQSNANNVDELVSMVTIQRRFEASSNMMRMIHDSYRRLLNAR